MKDKNSLKRFFCASAAAAMLLQQFYLPIPCRVYADTLQSKQTIEGQSKKSIDKSIGNTQGNLVNGGLLAVTEDYIYYCEDGLHRIKHDGTGKERLTQVGTGEINVIGEWIYCIKDEDDGNSYMYKMKTDGSNKIRISDDMAMHMFVVGDWIYYKNNSDNGKLYKIDINGMNKTKICDDIVYDMEDYVGFMTVCDDYIYYFVQDNGINFYRIKVDGTQRTNLNQKYCINFHACQSIQVVDGWIYYGGYDGLYKVRTDGSSNTKICEDAWCYNVTGNNIYFMGEQNKVEKMKTDGSGREIVIYDDRVDFFYAFEDYVYYFKNRELQKRNTNPQHKAQIVGVDDITYNINKSEKIYFPGNVKAKMNDGSTQFVEVQWQNKDISTSTSGVYKFKGIIQGYDKDVILTVNVATINTYNELMEVVRKGKKDFIIGNVYLDKSYNKAVEIVNELISDNMSDIEKEIIIHDYVVNTTVYDTENYLKGTYGQSLGILEALSEDGRAVCAGYARAMELLLNLAGVECYYVTGNTAASPHAWNVVKINGEYYHVDATWDDPDSEDNEIRYNYFNLSDAEISKDHFIHEESSKKYSGSGSDKYKILRQVLNLQNESLKSQKYYKDSQYIYYVMDGSLNKIDINNLHNINIEKGNILRMTVQDQWIYYVMNDECYNKTLYKIKKDGTQKRKLGKLPNEQCSIDYLISDEEALYLSVNDWESEKIYRMDLKDYSLKTVADEGSSYMALYDDCIYYSNKADGNRLYKIKKNGSKKTKLSDLDVWNLEVKGEYLYYDTGHAIYSIKNSSQHGRQLSGDRIDPIWLAEEHTEILGHYIYYANSSDGNMLYRVKKDGTDIKRLDNNEVGTREICQDGEYIYYTNYSSDLFRINVDGRNKKKLAHNFTSNICCDDEWIYYIGNDEEYVQKLYKVDKYGRKAVQLTEERVWNFKVGKDYIYYTAGEEVLYRIDKAGRNKEVVCDDEVREYVVKDNSVYYVKYNERLFNNEIIRIDENCKKEVIYHDDYIESVFHIIGNSIYYNDKDYNVYSVNMNKSEDRNFICNAYVSRPNSAAFYKCGEYIYFKDCFDKSVYRVKKDGSQLTKICGAASNIIGISDSELYYVSNVKKEKLKLLK